MKKYSYLFPYLIICLALVAGYAIVSSDEAGAQKISFPVAELGSCANESECKTFCDDPDNITACVDFAERNGLMSDEEVSKARKFIKVGARGPGGCRGENECEAYCEDIAHIDECLAFAEDNGFIDEGELIEAKKVSVALKGGASLPGGCKNKAQCESYCDDLDNISECLDFAEKSGFLDEAELAEARQAAKAMESGARPPGGCKNKRSCDDYCSDPSNMEECFAFAERAGFIPPEELEQARKVIPLMKAGKTPGGCKSKESCEAYCEDEANMEVCANFAIEAGFMKPEEAEMFRKTGGKGPGGCRGRKCESFCNDPANQETCFNFASEHGLIPPEELEQMKEGFQQFREGLDSAPPEVAECLKSSLGSEAFDKLQSGQSMPGRQMGESMRNCFEQAARERFEGGEGEGFGPPEGFEQFRGGEGEGFGPPRGFEGGERFGPPPGVSPEDFERFKEEGGFPGGEGGGFPSEEEIEKFQKGEFNQEDFNQGGFQGGRGPSPEQIQGVIQQRTQQRTQEIIQQKTQEQMERFGAPRSGSSGQGEGSQQFFGPSGSGPSINSGPSGSGFGPGPSEFNQQTPSGGFQQFNPSSGSPLPNSGPSSGGFQQFSPPPSDGGGQFAPPPPGGGTLTPPPTSSALEVILFPLINLLER